MTPTLLDTAYSSTIVGFPTSSGTINARSFTEPEVNPTLSSSQDGAPMAGTGPVNYSTGLAGISSSTWPDAAVLPLIREMTKRTECFDPARDAVLSPRLPLVRKLIDEADELATDKAKRLEAANIGYAENVRNAHRPLGDPEETQQAKHTPRESVHTSLPYSMYGVPVSKHQDGYGQIHTSEPMKICLLLEPVSEEVSSGRAPKKLEDKKKLREERRKRGNMQVKDLLNEE